MTFCLDIYSTFCISSNSLLYSWNESVSCTRLDPTLDNVNDDDLVYLRANQMEFEITLIIKFSSIWMF